MAIRIDQQNYSSRGPSVWAGPYYSRDLLFCWELMRPIPAILGHYGLVADGLMHVPEDVGCGTCQPLWCWRLLGPSPPCSEGLLPESQLAGLGDLMVLGSDWGQGQARHILFIPVLSLDKELRYFVLFLTFWVRFRDTQGLLSSLHLGINSRKCLGESYGMLGIEPGQLSAKPYPLYCSSPFVLIFRPCLVLPETTCSARD